MSNGECLVVYYSRSGNTRHVAEAIAQELGAVIEEIVDRKRRSGTIGFIGGGKDAAFNKLTEIDEPTNDPSAFGLVVVGTPVWAGKMTPAVRTWLSRFRDALPQVAFIATAGGQSGAGTFKGMGELLGKQPVSTLSFTEKRLKGEDWRAEVRQFVAGLKAGHQEPLEEA